MVLFTFQLLEEFVDIVFLLARILLAVLVLSSALGHLTQTEGMAQYAASRGIPAAKAGVIVSGLALLAGGVSVLVGIWGDLGALGLAVLFVIFAFGMQSFWKESDPMAKMNTQIAFNKDLALAGGALAFFVVFQVAEIGYTVTGPLL